MYVGGARFFPESFHYDLNIKRWIKEGLKNVRLLQLACMESISYWALDVKGEWKVLGIRA
jgi:hypothetical protein